MATRIQKIHIHNYRALADAKVDLGPINVFFGPNGSGKSTLLDTLWFLHDCVTRGVDTAAAHRGQGVGLLFDGAPAADQTLHVIVSTESQRYGLALDLSSGRIGPFPAEALISFAQDNELFRRRTGAESVEFLERGTIVESHPLRDPTKVALNLYLDFKPEDAETAKLDRLLRRVRLYHSRSFDLQRLKTLGAKASTGTVLSSGGDNAWSVLRNLRDRGRDSRYSTILQLMSEAFPGFEEIEFEQTGLTSVYAQFYEKQRRKAIPASSMSDGHLQLLLVLTALFGDEPHTASVILLDEPEVSLHPWALAVLANAVKIAAGETWNRQVLLATHSPVLISQFEPHEIFASESTDGQTKLRRVSEIDGIDDLLEQYAAGSLYMAEMLGAQTKPEAAE